MIKRKNLSPQAFIAKPLSRSLYRRRLSSPQAFIGAALLLLLAACSSKTTNETLDTSLANEDYLSANQYFTDGKNDSALIYINRALATADTTNYQKLTEIYLLSSKINSKLSLHEKAMQEALKALEISEHQHLIPEKINALLFIANIYYIMFNDNMAEQYATQAKTIAEENNFETEMRESYLLLGEICKSAYDAKIDRLDEAFSFFNKALQIAEKQSDTLNIIPILLHIGNYYISLNRYVDPDKIVKEHQKNAKKYLDEAIHLATLKNATSQQNLIRYSLIRWCNAEKNYAKGLEYALEILNNTPETPENYSMLLQIYSATIYLYLNLDNTQKALTYFNAYRALMAKESDYKSHRALQEMSVQYETAEKELEIERQQTEIERQQARLQQLIGILIFSVLLLAMLVMIVVQRTRRNRILAEMNTIKDKFFSIISHDLKNPVIMQHNALQLLADNTGKWDADTLSDYSALLLKSSDELMDLLRNLLDWSLLQRGRKNYNPTMFNLVAVLQPEINVIKNMAERKSITFEMPVIDTAIVTADQNMLKTVIRNLLANAVKFTASGGTVTLEIGRKGEGEKEKGEGRKEKGEEGKENGYFISVIDTGIGMSPEQIRNLFRIDTSHFQRGTAGEQGTGLGLIVCKEMLEKHGSRLHIESEEGKGSQFWFAI